MEERVKFVKGGQVMNETLTECHFTLLQFLHIHRPETGIQHFLLFQLCLQ